MNSRSKPCHHVNALTRDVSCGYRLESGDSRQCRRRAACATSRWSDGPIVKGEFVDLTPKSDELCLNYSVGRVGLVPFR